MMCKKEQPSINLQSVKYDIEWTKISFRSILHSLLLDETSFFVTLNIWNNTEHQKLLSSCCDQRGLKVSAESIHTPIYVILQFSEEIYCHYKFNPKSWKVLPHNIELS